MHHIGIIGGTGSSFGLIWESSISRETPFGEATYTQAMFMPDNLSTPVKVTCILRHGDKQQRLSNMVNHRANIWALHNLGVEAIIATTSCGIIDTSLPLAKPMIFDDLYFPDNRLPSGEACTFFSTPNEPGRGHLIAPQHFSPGLGKIIASAAKHVSLDLINGGTYSYALGPRFNSKAEIRSMASDGCSMVSQTAGPEAILAAEMEIPYALVGFGTDYANGVKTEPTPINILDENISKGKTIFDVLVRETIGELASQKSIEFDTGFVYRFF